MIKFALISLLLATCTAYITPILSARTIADTVQIVRKDNRGLQPTDDRCSTIFGLEYLWDTYLDNLYGVGFSCDCSGSGSNATISCQIPVVEISAEQSRTMEILPNSLSTSRYV